jgi:putative PEP-CTERM system histidine kinase
MSISFYAGLLVFASYAGLAVLLALRGQRSLPNYLLISAVTTTALWGLAIALFASRGPLPHAVPHFMAPIRDGSWFLLLIALLREEDTTATLWRRLAAVAAALIVLDFSFSLFDAHFDLGVGIVATKVTTHLVVSVMGLVLIENLVRNLGTQMLWSTKQLLIALGALFGYNIVLRIPQFLVGESLDILTIAQPLVYVVVLPLFVVTAVRNISLRLQVHSSRNFAFHSATLIFAGILLQGTAIAAFYVRRFGGTPAIVLSIVLGFAGLVAAVMAVSSRSVRSRIQIFINENFFSYKYDYRLEWTKFIRALSQYEERGGPERVLRTLADLLDSTGGILWVKRSGWQQFVPLAHWASGAKFGPLQATDEALAAFQDENVVFLDLGSDENVRGLQIWKDRFPQAWLAVPLRFRDELVGVALLQKPRAPRRLDWEDGNLISLIATQLAAHLIHEQTAQALADSQQLMEFNNRVTFALHDLKNTAGQLNLLLKNAERFGDDADFQADMMLTIRHAEENLRGLIAKLRDGDSAPAMEHGADRRTDVRALVARFAERKRRSGVVLLESTEDPVYASISEPGALETALEHIVANALEASPPNGEVRVSVAQADGLVKVAVRDDGPGMSEDFIAHELFRPLQTTKKAGLGIGAYQAREIMRSLSGDIEVQSTPGSGTTVSLFLPAASVGEARTVT